MKIRKIKIQDYKIFDNIEFDFTDEAGKTLDTIILAGINGTGKTTLIELLIKILSAKYEFESFGNFRFEVEFEDEELKIIKEYFPNEHHFYSSEEFFVIEELHKKSIINFECEYVEVIKQDGDNPWEKVINNLPLLNKIVQLINEENNFNISYFYNSIYFNLNISEKDTSNVLKYIKHYEYFEENLQKYFDKVIYKYLLEHRSYTTDEIIKKRIAEINSFLEGLNVNTKIVDIENNKLVLENIFGKKIQIKDLSDGEKQIYFRAIFLNTLNLKNSLIFVDEPEISLHPTWQSSAINLYKRAGNNNQTFFATHSPHIISSTNPENLFVLYINEDSKKVEVINMGKAGKHTKGVEANRILKNIMDTPLRDYETQKKIDYVARNIKKEYEKKDMLELIQELHDTLGQDDPFIIRLNNQLLMLKRKKSKIINETHK